MDDHAVFMERAFAQAKKSASEGGVPVGACLVHNGAVIAEGHNRRKQEETLILHGETDCLRNAGLFPHLFEATLYTTLSPCMMCAGTIVQFRIPRVVIGENRNFGGNEDFLRGRGVDVTILDDPAIGSFFDRWQAENPELWAGDIGL